MTIVAALSITPVHDGSSTEEIAATVSVLDEYDVNYEVDPMGTTIEAEDLSAVLAAAGAAHGAIDAERVRTVLQIDDDRTHGRDAAERVSAVHEALRDDSTDDPST